MSDALVSAADGMHTWVHVKTAPISENANSEQQHSISDVFQHNLACQGFRSLGLLRTSNMEAFNTFIVYYFTFETWSPFTAIVWEMSATLLSCETQAVFCRLQNFTRPSIGMRVTR